MTNHALPNIPWQERPLAAVMWSGAMMQTRSSLAT